MTNLTQSQNIFLAALDCIDFKNQPSLQELVEKIRKAVKQDVGGTFATPEIVILFAVSTCDGHLAITNLFLAANENISTLCATTVMKTQSTNILYHLLRNLDHSYLKIVKAKSDKPAAISIGSRGTF